MDELIKSANLIALPESSSSSMLYDVFVASVVPITSMKKLAPFLSSTIRGSSHITTCDATPSESNVLIEVL